MDKYYDENDILDDDFEDVNTCGETDDSTELNFDHKSDDDFPDDADEYTDDVVVTAKNLVNHLRCELCKLEPYRDKLKFIYNGESMTGIPMAEMKSGKFVFNVEGVLKAFNLKDMVLEQ